MRTSHWTPMSAKQQWEPAIEPPCQQNNNENQPSHWTPMSAKQQKFHKDLQTCAIPYSCIGRHSKRWATWTKLKHKLWNVSYLKFCITAWWFSCSLPLNKNKVYTQTLYSINNRMVLDMTTYDATSKVMASLKV